MKKDFSIFKLLIFMLGLAIIVLAAFLIGPLWERDTWRMVYSWISIALIYTAFALPLVLHNGTRDGDSTHVFIGGIVYYRGVIVYAIVSLGIIFLVELLRIPAAYAVVAQCVMIFVFMVYFFVACFTDDHIVTVNRQERSKMAVLQVLRRKSENLAIKADTLDDAYRTIKEGIAGIKDDIRYLAPSDDPAAFDLEKKIENAIDEISGNDIWIMKENVSGQFIDKQLSDLKMLIAQRKKIY